MAAHLLLAIVGQMQAIEKKEPTLCMRELRSWWPERLWI
jgi:hypothetical protein